MSHISPVHTLTPYSIRLTLMLLSHLHVGLSSGLFLSGFQLKFFIHFSSLLCTLYALPISPSLAWTL